MSAFSLQFDTRGIGKLTREVTAGLDLVAQHTAEQIDAHYKDAITTGAKTGHEYLVPTQGAARWVRYEGGPIPTGWKLHQASAPGEFPAGETGHLANDVTITKTGEGRRDVDFNADYAAVLEFGSEDGKLAARPAAGPAVELARPGFEAGAAAVLRGARP